MLKKLGNKNKNFRRSSTLIFITLTRTQMAGADPGFFLGGGALVSCSTSTPIKHIFVFFAGHLGGGGCAPPAPSPYIRP